MQKATSRNLWRGFASQTIIALNFRLSSSTSGQIRGQILITGLAQPRLAFLACLCIRPDHQKRGMGKTLVETAIRRTADMNFNGMVVVGEPRFYARFGFERSTGLGLCNLNGFDDRHVLARRLGCGTEPIGGQGFGGSGALILPE